MKRLGHIAWMALTSLGRARLRATLTTLGVTIASGALVSLVAFALGLQHQVEAPFRMLALLNNIQVMPIEPGRGLSQFSGRGLSQFSGTENGTVPLGAAKNSDTVPLGAEAASPKPGPPLTDEVVAGFKKVDGVAAAYPDIRAQGIKLRHGDHTEMAFAIGIPAEAALFGVEEEVVVAGRFFREGDKNECVVGRELLAGLGFAAPEQAIGQTIVMEATGLAPGGGESFTFKRKELPVTVVGVYEAPPLLPPGARRAVVLPVELMKEVPGVRFEAALSQLMAGGNPAAAAYTSATVRVADISELDRVAAEIAAMGYKTRTVASRLRGMQTFFVFLQVLLAVVGAVALVVAALGIVNTLLMSVFERYQEIGLYKAIGASDGDLAAMFLTEAAAFGALGGVAGLGLGWAVSKALDIAINVYAQRHGATEPLDLFAFPAWLLASTVGFSILVSVLAGVYPAVRAARVDPIRALRRE